jgi:hypothetical protein
MSDHTHDLAERRARLLLKSAAQRQQLGTLVRAIDSRIGAVDRGLTSARGFLKQPAILAGGAALALVVGPRRVLRLAGQAVLFFAAARRLLRLVRF